MVSEGDVKSFTVRVRKREVVASALPLQEHWLPLSNLDLLLPPVDVGVFFCYDKNIGPVMSKPTSFASMVGVLKKALAQALISFYAFAGELVTNFEGEPELLCNNRGVDFVEAFADVELCLLDLYNPDDSIEGKLVPSKKHGVLAVQVA
ncbi:hypothetical protein TIFTF001_017342 [Ficus carica]|uniref:Uncharacterized protein n=1 Tax=Ficus carica TaxID=3494 RepID=A0AA88DAN2_FICCA|nr:hypothetical protein TIFTF001_017342 [Ficus carica]